LKFFLVLGSVFGIFFTVAPVYAEPCSVTPVRIMPLGNSITKGSTGAEGELDSDKIGYRYMLYQLLTTAGYNFDFVGSLQAGSTSGYTFDYDHEGHGGKTDAWIASNVIDFLTANPADIVLLHIGTNGIDPDPSDVEDILDNIDSFSINVTVIVARIINRKIPISNVTEFNDNVEVMVDARITAGDGVVEIVSGGYYNDGTFDNAQIIVWNGETLTYEDAISWVWTDDTVVNSIAVAD
jgi:hypothetical protein